MNDPLDWLRWADEMTELVHNLLIHANEMNEIVQNLETKRKKK